MSSREDVQRAESSLPFNILTRCAAGSACGRMPGTKIRVCAAGIACERGKESTTLMQLTTLKKNKEFGLVYSRGRSCATRLMVLIYLPRKRGGVRAGFSVSKKVGKSVVRNKIRRRLKEAFRIYMANVKPSADLIFLARAPIAEAEFSAITRDMNYLLKKAGLTDGTGTA